MQREHNILVLTAFLRALIIKFNPFNFKVQLTQAQSIPREIDLARKRLYYSPSFKTANTPVNACLKNEIKDGSKG